MKNYSDEQILKESNKLSENQKLTSLSNFRKQFYEYLNSKKNIKDTNNTVNRPYIKISRLPSRSDSFFYGGINNYG